MEQTIDSVVVQLLFFESRFFGTTQSSIRNLCNFTQQLDMQRTLTIPLCDLNILQGC